MVLDHHPTGRPDERTWRLEESELAGPGEGEILVEVLYASVDPAMRQWIAVPDEMERADGVVPAVKAGDVMPALGIGRVLESRIPAYSAGDVVSGTLGIQEHVVVTNRGIRKVDGTIEPPTRHLSVLGMSGLTAYFGLLEVGDPAPGETVVVSGAGGGVGSVAVQLARIRGARTVAIAGGADKCRVIREVLGADVTIDRRAVTDLDAELDRSCPDGLDVYFDNVGGDLLDAALGHLAPRARVVLCGWMSQYNRGEVRGPSRYAELIRTGSSMTGFSVFQHSSRYRQASSELAGWLRSGELQALEHVVDGIEAFPSSVRMLFEGANTGKLIVKIGS
jgi:NADPH-dependent curcumin reductase CurA